MVRCRSLGLTGVTPRSNASVKKNRVKLKGVVFCKWVLTSFFLDWSWTAGANNPSGAPTASQSFMLRVRRALDHPDYPWQLRYLGQPELGAPFAAFAVTLSLYFYVFLSISRLTVQKGMS